MQKMFWLEWLQKLVELFFAENVFANPLLKSLNALLMGVVLAINIVLLRAKF